MSAERANAGSGQFRRKWAGAAANGGGRSAARKEKAEHEVTGAVETISGSVKGIVYHNDATGWLVATVKLGGDGFRKDAEVATVVGHCPTAWAGEDIRATGRWVRDPAHGVQFKADEIICVAPTSAEGIKRYLASGIIRGVGPKFASKIVERFGENTIDVLERDSGRLLEIPGLGERLRREIKKGWENNRGTRDAMLFLQGHGISATVSAKIYRQYGSNTVAMVKANPYRLCADIWGIGFLKADEIARKVGLPFDSPLRAKAGIYHVLQTLAEEGHCYSEAPELLLRASEQLRIPVDALENALREETSSGRIVDDGGRLYLRRLHRAESAVARRILTILDTRSDYPPLAAAAAVEWVSARLPFALTARQSEAVRMGLEHKFSIVTGGPGVGKTTIIKALCDIWSAKKRDVRLVAPTGRAARRMSESTGREAKTIHRLLKWNPQEAKFVHDAGNPVEADVFVVDECSMIDIELAQAFLSAVRASATVVLVGDTDQLPSVGAGNFLRDAIDSGVVPFTRLDAIFRQKTGGQIVRNAHRVNAGEPFLPAEDPETSDFFFVPCDDPQRTLSRVLEMVERRIPRRCNLSPLQDIQVLTPMRKNLLGADNLNDELQRVLNPTGPALVRFGRAYRVGDRVMQIRNNYDKDVFNGDIGFVKSVSEETHSLEADFDGRSVVYSVTELEELTHAYATSIHKSQGSEYPAVVIVIAKQHYMLLQRNLLYTAITRGRKLVCVIGSPWAVAEAIKNNSTLQRRTALAERLRNPKLPPLAPSAS